MDSTSESFFVIFILITCGGLFAAIWLGILFLVSRFGGWNRLYKCYKFPLNAQKPFKVKKFQSIQLGLSNYNGVMTLSLYPEGLGMEVMILFRFGHPKILIPWRDIKLKEKSSSIFFWNKLEVGNPSIATISVNNKILEELEPYFSTESLDEDRWTKS